MKRDLRSRVVGVLIDGGDHGRIVRATQIVGAVVMVEGRDGEQGVWIERVDPGERGIAIGLAFGVMQAAGWIDLVSD